MARSLARILAILAAYFLRREWAIFQARLSQIYQKQLADSRFRPTLLMEQLLISGEDHRFFQHGGIDPIALCRVVWRSVILQKREGASTIEMQIARVVTGRYERTFRRKIREMALATLVTRVIPKEMLPGLYLRIGYYGWRMNSLRGAYHRLQMNPQMVKPIEAARLVARLKYPQPRAAIKSRQSMIDVRARHLMRLRQRHLDDRTYVGLVVEKEYAAI